MGLIAVILLYFFSDNKKNKKLLVIGLIAILIIMSFVTYENIFSLFPITASIITFYSFLNKDKNMIRLAGIIAAALWVVYAIIIKSYTAIIFESITVITTTIAYFKKN